MMQRLPAIIVSLALTFALAALVAGCAAPQAGGRLALAGSIRDEETVVAVPRLTAEATAAPDPGWALVASVPVDAGDTVATGTVLAVLDAAVPRAALVVAEADVAEARAQEALLAARLDEVADRRAEVRGTRADVRAALARLREQRAQLAAQLAQARKLASQLPPGAPLPPGTPPQQDPRAIVARLEAALARIDAGIAQATAGLARLADASAQLSDARSALSAGRDVARSVVDARLAAADLARARLALATVRAPATGVVTRAPVLGAALAAGAPLARVRTASAGSEVVTYATARQAAGVAEGDPAEVRVDSLPGRTFTARVERIGDEYPYVPTRIPTREIHLLRGVEVRLLLDDATLPPGTPADVTILPGR